MKKKLLFAEIGVITALSLVGCQAKPSNTDASSIIEDILGISR